MQRTSGSVSQAIEPQLVAEPALQAGEPAPSQADLTRLARAASESFEFLWRVLRRLGVLPEAAVDDAVQRVFEIATRKAGRIPEGAERAFLFRTAVLVAAEERRRQRQSALRAGSDDPLELESAGPDPEHALSQRRDRALLDEALDALPEKLRTAFVLFELEGLTCAQIAVLLEIPPGTAASRLRLAREQFHTVARRLRAHYSRGTP